MLLRYADGSFYVSKEVRRISKKKRKYAKLAKSSKGSVVWHLSADEATLAEKPHYNGFACGHGVQGDTKYNRAKMKRTWKNELRREGASRGSFDFYITLRIQP